MLQVSALCFFETIAPYFSNSLVNYPSCFSEYLQNIDHARVPKRRNFSLTFAEIFEKSYRRS